MGSYYTYCFVICFFPSFFFVDHVTLSLKPLSVFTLHHWFLGRKGRDENNLHLDPTEVLKEAGSFSASEKKRNMVD